MPVGGSSQAMERLGTASYTLLGAHETGRNIVCRLLLEKKNIKKENIDRDAAGAIAAPILLE